MKVNTTTCVVIALRESNLYETVTLAVPTELTWAKNKELANKVLSDYLSNSLGEVIEDCEIVKKLEKEKKEVMVSYYTLMELLNDYNPLQED